MDLYIAASGPVMPALCIDQCVRQTHKESSFTTTDIFAAQEGQLEVPNFKFMEEIGRHKYSSLGANKLASFFCAAWRDGASTAMGKFIHFSCRKVSLCDCKRGFTDC